MGEWDNRELCPDGGCVGLIGKNGTCGVCGRAGERKRPAVAPAVEDHDVDAAAAGDEDDDDLEDDDDDYEDGDDGGDYEDDDDDDDDDGDADADEHSGERPAVVATPRAAKAAKAATGGDDWDQRQLCPDGACTGVIGAKGVCTVCGTAPPSPSL